MEAKRKKLKKRKVSKRPVRKSRTYKSLWTGDYDKDGVKNIDDYYPFDKRRTRNVDPEVRLYGGWKNLSARRNRYKRGIKPLSKMLGAKLFRVKSAYSTINKQITRYIGNIKDMGAMIIMCKNRAEVMRKSRAIVRKFGKGVIDFENHYILTKAKKRDKNPYMAVHITLLYHGLPYEVQVKTKPMYDLHLKMHLAYKRRQYKRVKAMFKRAMELRKKGY